MWREAFLLNSGVLFWTPLIWLETPGPNTLDLYPQADAVKSSFSLPQFRDINFSSLSSGFVIHNVENAEVDSASLQFGEMVQIYHSG